MLPSDYIERVYAGVLGKTIGVRHGSNDEGWSYEKIRETFGEVTDYLFTFRNFAADDDTNGTFLLPLACGYSSSCRASGVYWPFTRPEVPPNCASIAVCNASRDISAAAS